jgi:hypothetical protein
MFPGVGLMFFRGVTGDIVTRGFFQLMVELHPEHAY